MAIELYKTSAIANLVGWVEALYPTTRVVVLGFAIRKPNLRYIYQLYK